MGRKSMRTLRVLAVMSLAASTVVLVASPASAAAQADVLALDCGYTGVTNTFKPVATVLRTSLAGDPEFPDDERIAVAMFLLDPATDPPTQIASLGTGLAGGGAGP